MDIFISIIKSKFTLFQMQIKSGCRDAVELKQSTFSKRPKRFTWHDGKQDKYIGDGLISVIEYDLKPGQTILKEFKC